MIGASATRTPDAAAAALATVAGGSMHGGPPETVADLRGQNKR